MIKNAPLQAYISAFKLSPLNSLTCKECSHKEPMWVNHNHLSKLAGVLVCKRSRAVTSTSSRSHSRRMVGRSPQAWPTALSKPGILSQAHRCKRSKTTAASSSRLYSRQMAGGSRTRPETTLSKPRTLSQAYTSKRKRSRVLAARSIR